jgi:hypothetical protein
MSPKIKRKLAIIWTFVWRAVFYYCIAIMALAIPYMAVLLLSDKIGLNARDVQNYGGGFICLLAPVVGLAWSIKKTRFLFRQ